MKCLCYGEKLIAAGTLLAFEIAQNKTPEQINTLGALFTVIGDELALLGGLKGVDCDNSEDNDNNTFIDL